jgi:hypothetical protein
VLKINRVIRLSFGIVREKNGVFKSLQRRTGFSGLYREASRGCWIILNAGYVLKHAFQIRVGSSACIMEEKLTNDGNF